jgi:hypothetical protein
MKTVVDKGKLKESSVERGGLRDGETSTDLSDPGPGHGSKTVANAEGKI